MKAVHSLASIWVAFGFVAVLLLMGSGAQAKVVACVGASNTYGYGLANRQSDCYPAQLGRMLRVFDHEWEVYNFGVSGACVLQKGSLPYIRQSAFTQARGCNPDVVVIQLGGNSSLPANWVYKDDFLTDFLVLIDAFLQLPSQPQIYVLSPPPVYANPYGLDDNVIRGEIIPLMTQLPTYRDVQVVDLYTPMKDSWNLFQGDGVHWTVEGARLVAQIVAATIIGMRGTPDLNGDGIVNLKDFSRVAQYWGQYESSLDMAPTPFGDGIVDVRDVAVLADWWLEDIGLIAHWKLDETEGIFASDSAGDNDGVLVIQNPLWRPFDGQVGGALEFDGVDDFVLTDFVLDPGAGRLSVFAWVRGGAPGQVILSQTGSANWLMADASEGKFGTELKGTGRFDGPLSSQAVITDGDWHRVGLTCDGSNRTLYVDNARVAKDTQSGFGSSQGGLYIGAGKNLEPGSLWSGLIDDVRIYERPANP